jgi:hypothetical protein
VLESEKIQKEKDLAGAAKTVRSLGAPDCPVVHRTVFGAPGWRLVNWPLSGIRRRRTAKSHRTVRWYTGLSGEPTVGQANGRPRNPHVTRGRANGLNGAPDCPMRTRQCPVRQRLQIFNGRLCQFWKSNLHQTLNSACPVAHQTVRCATRQKARIAFPDCLQRLLAALGLQKGPLVAWRRDISIL